MLGIGIYKLERDTISKSEITSSDGWIDDSDVHKGNVFNPCFLRRFYYLFHRLNENVIAD